MTAGKQEEIRSTVPVDQPPLVKTYLDLAKDNCGAYEITGLAAAGVYALISLAESAERITAELKRMNDREEYLNGSSLY